MEHRVDTLSTQQQGEVGDQQQEGHHFQGVAIVMLCVVGIGCVLGIAFVVLHCRCCCIFGRRRRGSANNDSTKRDGLESVCVEVHTAEPPALESPGRSVELIKSNSSSSGLGDLSYQRSHEDASEWARRMMMTVPSTGISTANSGVGREEEGCSRDAHVMTIPVEETVYIEQPDGKHTLAVSRRFKDVMVHVVESDLGMGHVDMQGCMQAGGLIESLHGSYSKYYIRTLHDDCDYDYDNDDERIQKEKMTQSSSTRNISKNKKRKKKKKRYCDGWCQTTMAPV